MAKRLIKYKSFSGLMKLRLDDLKKLAGELGVETGDCKTKIQYAIRIWFDYDAKSLGGEKNVSQ